MKKLILYVLLVLNSSFTYAQSIADTISPVKLSLYDIWQKVDENSKAIELRKFNVEIKNEEIRDAQIERLPELSVAGNLEKATNLPMYTNGLFNEPVQHEVIHTLYRVGGGTYFNLYNGGKTNLKIAEGKTLFQIAEEKKNMTISEIKLRAAAYYFDLQRSYIFRDLMIKDIANQEKQLDEVKHFLKNGVVLKSDVLRIELKLSQQKMVLVQIENDILIANQRLNILIGEADEYPIFPTEQLNPGALPLKSYEEYLDEAMNKAYENRISEKETALRKLQLKMIRANIAPKVGLYGDFYYANPQIFLYPYAPNLYSLGIGGIKASFPISSFYHNRHKTTAAKLEYEKQELEHQDTQDKVRERVKEAYLRYKEALIRINVSKVNVDQAEENWRIIKNTYFNKTSLVTDLLDADVQRLQTQFDLAAAEIAAQLQFYKLQHVIGNLYNE